MSDGIRLVEATLSSAGAKLIAASSRMQATRPRPPVRIPMITGASGEIDGFLAALEVARESLAEAARLASLTVSAMAEESSALDAGAAASVPRGYSQQRGTP